MRNILKHLVILLTYICGSTTHASSPVQCSEYCTCTNDVSRCVMTDVAVNSKKVNEYFLPFPSTTKHLLIINFNISELLVDDFSNVKQLQTLNLSNNWIKKISPGSFNNLLNLELLNLDDNLLNELPIGVFTNLPSLKRLSLNNNPLSNINWEALTKISPKNIELNGVSVDCKCNILAYLSYLSLNKVVLTGGRCKSYDSPINLLLSNSDFRKNCVSLTGNTKTTKNLLTINGRGNLVSSKSPAFGMHDGNVYRFSKKSSAWITGDVSKYNAYIGNLLLIRYRRSKRKYTPIPFYSKTPRDPLSKTTPPQTSKKPLKISPSLSASQVRPSGHASNTHQLMSSVISSNSFGIKVTNTHTLNHHSQTLLPSSTPEIVPSKTIKTNSVSHFASYTVSLPERQGRSCYQCNGVSINCSNVIRCKTSENSCDLSVFYDGSTQTIRRDCAKSCDQTSNCRSFSRGLRCRTCCTTDRCNEPSANATAMPKIQNHEFQAKINLDPNFNERSLKTFMDSSLPRLQLYLSNQEEWPFPVIVLLNNSSLLGNRLTTTIRVTSMTWGSERDVLQLRSFIKSRIESFTDNGRDVFDKNVRIDSKDLCKETRSETEFGTIVWPIAKIGWVYKPCPNNHSEKAARHCTRFGVEAEWSFIEDEKCSSKKSETTKKLIAWKETLRNQIPAGREMTKVTELLKKASTESKSFSGTEVTLIIDILSIIIHKTLDNMTKEDIDDTLTIINNILQASKLSLERAENKGSVQRLIKMLEYFSQNIPISDNSVVFSKPLISLAAIKLNLDSFKGVTLSVSSTSTEVNEGKMGEFEDGVFIPQSIVPKIPIGTKRTHFVVYNDSTLYDIMDKNKNENESVATKVISATIGSGHIYNLPDPVVLTFSHELNKRAKRCVYWDDETWSGSGCELKTADGTHTVCSCNHLSSFAVIMKLTDDPIPEGHEQILHIISLVGCSISVGGLVLTIFTYMMFGKLRREKPAKLLLNLCFALVALNVFFIVSIHPLSHRHPTVCKIIAVFLHYSLLSGMMWMGIEAAFMYIALVRVFDTHIDKFLLKCCIIGWGIPLVIVAVTLGHNSTDNYRLLGNICWVEQTAFYGAVLAPVAFILLTNFIVFILVVRQINGLAKRKVKMSETSNMASQLRGAVGVAILLGLTWIFAIFAIGKASLVFQYLFTIFNSLQGLFIFLFYCMLKKDAQNAWIKACYPGTEIPSSSFQSTSKASERYAYQKSKRGRLGSDTTNDGYSISNGQRSSLTAVPESEVISPVFNGKVNRNSSKTSSSEFKTSKQKKKRSSASSGISNDGFDVYEKRQRSWTQETDITSLYENGHRSECPYCRASLGSVDLCTKL